jgi:hypothetical protein
MSSEVDFTELALRLVAESAVKGSTIALPLPHFVPCGVENVDGRDQTLYVVHLSSSGPPSMKPAPPVNPLPGSRRRGRAASS